jgi:hypothetical protein
MGGLAGRNEEFIDYKGTFAPFAKVEVLVIRRLFRCIERKSLPENRAVSGFGVFHKAGAALGQGLNSRILKK